MTSTSALSVNKTAKPQVLERVAEVRLRESGHRPLRDLSCTSNGGTVSIHGSVPSYYMKQLAQTIVGRVDEVRRIENHVKVVEHRS